MTIFLLQNGIKTAFEKNGLAAYAELFSERSVTLGEGVTLGDDVTLGEGVTL